MLVHIERVSPRVAQRGTTVEVTIQGMCLKDAREVAFFRPGIRAVGIEISNLLFPMTTYSRCEVMSLDIPTTIGN